MLFQYGQIGEVYNNNLYNLNMLFLIKLGAFTRSYPEATHYTARQTAVGRLV